MIPKQYLVAWEIFIEPKDKGGVGILNFEKKKNEDLLLKHLDKFYNRTGIYLGSTLYGSLITHSFQYHYDGSL